MPVPQPKPNESQDEFIQRCIRTLSHIDKNRPQKQIIAICYGKWRNKGKKKEECKENKGVVPEIVRKADEEILSVFKELDSEAWYKKPGQRPGIQKGDKNEEEDLSSRQRSKLPDSAFACIIGEGDSKERKLLINDEAHCRNAMARYNQSEGCKTPEVKSKICRAAKKFGIDNAFEKGGFCYTAEKKEENLDMTIDEIKKKIKQNTMEREKLYQKMWPSQPQPKPVKVSDAERIKLQGELGVINAELETLVKLLQRKMGACD